MDFIFKNAIIQKILKILIIIKIFNEKKKVVNNRVRDTPGGGGEFFKQNIKLPL